MGIILDLLIVAIIALMVFLSAKRGFMRTLIEVVGFVAALFVAFTFSTPIASTTYNKVIEPTVIKTLIKETEEKTSVVIDDVWDSVPKFLTNNSPRFGLTKEGLAGKLSSMEITASDVATTISNDVIEPVLVKMLSLAIATILLVVLLVVVNFLAKFINKLVSFSLVGKLNRALGGVVGLLKGIVLAVVFCLAVNVIVSFTENGFLIFTNDAIESSTLFSTICNFFPFFK